MFDPTPISDLEETTYFSDYADCPDHVHYAIEIVTHGWPVLAVPRGSKATSHAPSSLPNHGDFWLRTPIAVATAWEETRCQFAIMTGIPNKNGDALVALDADVDGHWGLLDTFLVNAGSEALTWAKNTLRIERCPERAHLLGTVPASLCPKTCEVASDGKAKLEWRGAPGYLLARGALHPSGSRYRRVNGTLLPVPAELLRAVTPETQGSVPDSWKVAPELSPISNTTIPQQSTSPSTKLEQRPPEATSAFDGVVKVLREQGRSPAEHGGRAIARCPGPRHRNGDRNPSLSLSRVDGKVLLHCFSGCTPEEVLEALGLETADLFDKEVTVTLSPQGAVLELSRDSIRTLPSYENELTRAYINLSVKEDARALFEDSDSDFDEAMTDETDLMDVDPLPPPTILELGEGTGEFLIREEEIVSLHGKSSAGKTPLAYMAAVEQVKKGYLAVILNYEMGKSRVSDLLLELGLTKEQIQDGIYLLDHPRFLTTKHRESFSRKIQEKALLKDRIPRIAIIDSLTKSLFTAPTEVSDDNSGAVARWYDQMPRWISRTLKVAVLVIDHDGNSNSERAAGSHKKGEEPDLGLWLRQDSRFGRKHEDGQSSLINQKDRSGEMDDQPIAILKTRIGGTFYLAPPQIAGDAHGEAESISVDGSHITPWDAATEELLETIRDVGAGGISKTDLIGRGREGVRKRQALASLLKRQIVEEVQEGASRMVYLTDYS